MTKLVYEELQDLFCSINFLELHKKENFEKFRTDAQDLITQLRLNDRRHPGIKEYECRLADVVREELLNSNKVKSTVRRDEWNEKSEKRNDKSENIDRLQEARSVLFEIEEVGDDVLKNLAEQRKKIIDSTEKVSAVQSTELPMARKFINSMSKWWK